MTLVKRSSNGSDEITQPCLRLVVKHPVPSLNSVLGMHHMQIVRLKHQIQESVLSALRAFERDNSKTQTTEFTSGILMPSDVLACWMTTRRKRSVSKSCPKSK